MTDNPRVTIAIPFYNADNYIDLTIDSILAQTYPNIEFLLLDDGSTDNSLSIVQERLQNNKNARILLQENRGEGACRQRLVEENRNPYFYFLDADDIIAPNAIEVLVKAALKNDSDMTIGNHYIIRIDGSIKLPRHRIGTQNLTPRQLYQHYLKHKIFKSYLWGILYRPSVLENNIVFPIGKKFIDMAVMPDIIFNSEKITFIDEPLYGYRQNPTGIVRSANTTAHEDQMDFLQETGRYVQNMKERNLYEALIASHLYSLTRNTINKMEHGQERENLKTKSGKLFSNIGAINILKNPEIRIKLRRRILFWYFKDLLGLKHHPHTY